MKDDTISRKDAIDALDKRFDSIPMEQTTEILQLRKDLRELPSAQPETHDKRTESHACDLISRAMLLDYIHNEPIGKMLCDRYNLDGVIKQLPSAQPGRKRGKWIYGEDEYGIDGYHCDKCGFFVPWDYAHKFINYIEDYKFCPGCGADMREVDDERHD